MSNADESPVPPAIAQPFFQGLRNGLDPAAAERGQTPYRAITSLRSPWLHGRCSVCDHTFRPGDEVMVRESGRVLHDMPGLRCDDPQREEAAGEEATNQAFYQGLAAAWPMPDAVPVVRLDSRHWLLAPPPGDCRRHACRVRGHSFRSLDHVVLCPCNPQNPRCRDARPDTGAAPFPDYFARKNGAVIEPI